MKTAKVSLRLMAMVVVLALVAASSAWALNIEVVDGAGNPVSGFRYIIEEDPSHQVTPGVQSTDVLGLGIHRSYSRVVDSGETATNKAKSKVQDDRAYLVSVLPSGGYGNSGKRAGPGAKSVTVTVIEQPFPTAQVSVYVFHDHKPLNAAADVPAEEGLAGFGITLHDNLGHMMMDAFGNMIGTTYMKNGDGSFMLDAEGSPVVDMAGSGVVLTDANGEALIQNLAPNKVGVVVTPPAGEGWIQTSTIEGTHVVDAWLRAGEPARLGEFGTFFWHTFYGFTKAMSPAPSPEGTGTITGQVFYLHEAKLPNDRGLASGRPIDQALVGLTDLSGSDETIWVGACDDDGSFTMNDIPPGTYQVAVFDLNLDVIISFQTAVVPPEGGLVAMGNIPCWAWFGNLEGTVFRDDNSNGMPDEGEPGLPDIGINLRLTDGSIYQATTTDPAGRYSMTEVFPWFRWIIAEVDFARHLATGATIIVDDGGPTAPGEVNVPQLQPENGGLGYRVENEPNATLLEAMLLYAGQTNEIYWGKKPYEPGQNGGISGVIVYASTRAENDPTLGTADPWEPGIPRVQVCLYQDTDGDGVPDDVNGDGRVTLSDVDNHPFGWAEGGAMGPEDVKRSVGGKKIFNAGDALNIAWSDCWQDNQPEGVGDPQFVRGVEIPSGAETLRTWNQVRPGVFDGGYAFLDYVPGGYSSGNAAAEPIPTGYYVVEAVPPPNYVIVKEEDKNVDFGLGFVPNDNIYGLGAAALPPPLSPPPPAVGDLHLVPAELDLFPGVPCEFAGQMRPLADRRWVFVGDGRNAACDFHMFTKVPTGAHVFGICNDDLLFDDRPDSVNYRSNYAPPWLPISFRDWQGNELVRVYSDEWGKFSAIVPSTFTANIPTPSGYSPNMLFVSCNDPGPVPDPNKPKRMIVDPWFNPDYMQCVYTLDFWPGKTTFCDTPVIPIVAFAGQGGLDCEPPSGTPAIYSAVNKNKNLNGPYVLGTSRELVIESVGPMQVRNPDYDRNDPNSVALITRDYGFGAVQGTVRLNGVAIPIKQWKDDEIRVTVPVGATTGQLMITRGDTSITTPVGLTLYVNPANPIVTVASGQKIQDAIDAAPANAIIFIAPGVYNEHLIVWKPLKLQGSGAHGTILNGANFTPGREVEWNAKLQGLVDGGSVNLLPGVTLNTTERGSGISVFGNGIGFLEADPPRIDGITVTGSGTSAGGAARGCGILINAYTSHMRITNNRIVQNQGSFGGGIRIGTPSVLDADLTGFASSENSDVLIQYNKISRNGSAMGGGGIAIFNGADDYQILDNGICGNFTIQYGGGIAHFGLSPNGVIARNKIVNNQAVDEGGGIMIAGELTAAGGVFNLTPGSGSVTVDRNLIQGNLSTDDGGGIRLLMTNGLDVAESPLTPVDWHTVGIFNNLIVNNVSADAGGGISMDDATRVFVVNNTIAHNDSTATAVDAFGAIGGVQAPDSTPQVAGIAANALSEPLRQVLRDALGEGNEPTYSDPVIEDCIIYGNRYFYWDADYNVQGGLRPDIAMGEAPVFWDLGAYNTPENEILHPMNSVLTSLTAMFYDGTTAPYDGSNVAADPLFADGYYNALTGVAGENAINLPITLQIVPLGMRGNYHITTGSPAIDLGLGARLADFPILASDYDGQIRPMGVSVDSGADELQ